MLSTTIWNSALVQKTLDRYRMGLPTDMSCFHFGDIELKANNILYQLTEEEIEEFHKCSKDIIYFVEKYCRFLTDEGRKTIKLRDYQKRILTLLTEEIYSEKIRDLIPKVRNLIMMQSRQSGKCLFLSNVTIMYPDNKKESVPLSLLYYMSKKSLSLLEKIKVKLLKIYSKRKNKIIKYFILYLIELIEKWEYRNKLLDENDISKKIIDTIKINNLKIETPQGFKSISRIHKTQPYTIWKIKTKKGLYLECADNHIVFNNFGKQVFIKELNIGDYIQVKGGIDEIVSIKKMPFKASMYDVTINYIEHTFYSNDIVSHNTTTIAAYLAWYMCFHNDRNLAILANKQATAFEIVNKVTDVFRGLPFFLKPGVINIGAGGMRLDNGCYLTSQATTKTAQIGFTIHVLYIDEFAHIQKNIAEDFWRSVYPTLASSEISQCIISSTPNGDDNIFFNIWDKAQKKLNSFVPIRVDWWEVPGHDEKWAKQMIQNFGEEYFAQEFALDFTKSTAQKLLDTNDILFMSKIEKKYVYNELEKTDLDTTLYINNLKWHPDFDPNIEFNTKEHRFILSIDTGEGRDENELKDNDYNICNIFKVEPKSISQLKKLRSDELRIKNMFRLVQVGLYRDNIKDEENAAKIVRSLVFDQFGADLCKVLIEMNFNGKYFLEKFSQHKDYDESVILHTYHTKPIPGEKPPRKKPGFKVTRGNKDIYCKLAKKLVHKKIIILNETETIKEFKSFQKDKNGKWRGIGSHDDIAMSTINISHLYEEPEYEDWLYDFLDEMPDSKIKTLINELLEKYTENKEITDEEFKELYGDIEENKEILPINIFPKPFNNIRKIYFPSQNR